MNSTTAGPGGHAVAWHASSRRMLPELASALGMAGFGTLYLALAQDHDATIAVDAFALVAAALGGAALLAAAAASRSVRNGKLHGVQRPVAEESARLS